MAAEGGSARPLGTLALYTWTRCFGQSSRRRADGKKKSGRDYAQQTDKESARWYQQVQASSEQVGNKDCLIHVADREADCFELLSNLVSDKHRFVIRLRVDRSARDCETLVPQHVLELIDQAEDVLEIQVPVGKRQESKVPATKKTFPAREQRQAKLAFRATTVQIKRPRYVDKDKHEDWLKLNVVQVHELEAPEGAEPVCWTLLTTEPIETVEQIRRVVSFYKQR